MRSAACELPGDASFPARKVEDPHPRHVAEQVKERGGPWILHRVAQQRDVRVGDLIVIPDDLFHRHAPKSMFMGVRLM